MNEDADLGLSVQKNEKKHREEPVDDSQVVDDLFTYLKNEDDEDIKRNPDALKGLPTKGRKKSETVMRKIPQAPAYTEDTSEFSFVKFSKTYFQGILFFNFKFRAILTLQSI